MPDLEELLSSAARPPRRPVDVEAVAQRAQVLQRRERAALMAGVALLIVPAVLLLTSGTDGDSRLVPAPVVSQPTESPVGVSFSPGVGRTGTPRRSGGSSGSARAAAGSSTGAARGTARPARSASVAPSNVPPAAPSPENPSPGSSDFPARSSCGVATTALGPGESASCRFTAIGAGGWAMVHSAGGAGYYNQLRWTVEIERGGIRSTFKDRCATDRIRPGDRVTLTITQTDVGYFDVRLDAGTDFSC